MADSRRVCAYWALVNTTPDEATATYDYRCVAAHSEFTGYDWTADDISCFNEDPDLEDYGLCDGEGGITSCWVCSKYAPGGMAFGLFDPETRGYRLPFIFEVYNLRAKMGKCCFWDSATSDDYEVNQANGQIDKVTNRCSKGALAQQWNDPTQPTGPTVASGVLFDIPCNGVKAECIYYTGIPWEYCIDDKMQDGDRILAQQIQELRYYSDDWDYYDNPIEIFKGKYIDPDIFAWHGTFVYQNRTTKILEEEVDQAEFGTINFPVLDKVELEKEDGSFTGDMTSTKILPTGGTRQKDGPPDYPTFIKALNDSVRYRPAIYFPYNNYIHKHWTDNGNKVSVIGASNGASGIYLVNGSLVGGLPKEKIDKRLLSEASGDPITDSEQTAFNSAVTAFLVDLAWYSPENLYQVTPDTTSGYFLIEDVELEIGESQTLYLFSIDSSSNWSVFTVRVHDYFYHTFIQQEFFSQTWWKDNNLGSDSNLSGKFAHMTSRKNFDDEAQFVPSTSIENFYWRNQEETGGLFGSPLNRYSYYVVKVAAGNYDVPEDDWRIISTCGETLVKIDDTNINRPYGWKIETAIMSATLPDGTSIECEMESEYPADLSDLDENLPANYAILKPKEGESFRWFSSKDASLTINYSYYREKPGPVNLQSGETLVTSGTNILIETPPMSITYSDDNYSISSANERTMSFRANVTDEEGRIIGVKNQKLLVQYNNVLCRDYEIEYRWLANYKTYQWYPTNWIMYEERIPFELRYQGDTNKYMVPTCGDHDLPPESLIVFGYDIVGPMWYPYTECNDEINYQVATIANICNLYVEDSIYGGGDRDATDHRNRAPDESYPEIFGDPHPTVFVCKTEYDYGYSEKISANIFNGAGNARGEVDLVDYIAEGWDFPKFGNVLREQRWTNRCTDYINYFDYQIQVMGYDWKWVPVLEYWCDEEDLFSENVLHPFMFLQADTVTGESINEYEDPTLYRYEDVLVSKYSSQIQYPTDNIYYQFVESDLTGLEAVQWLYREKWQDLVRTTSKENKVTSAVLSYADYVYGYSEASRGNDEFQRTADEGSYVFLFSPPIYDTNGDISDDAYFRILPGPPRYIDLATSEWKDSEALVGGAIIIPKYKYWSSGGDWETEPNLWTEAVTTGDKTEAVSKGNYYKTYDDQTLEESEHYFFKGVNIEVRNSYFPYTISPQLKGSEYDTSLKLNATTGHDTRDLDDYGVWEEYDNGRLNPYNQAAINNRVLEWIPSKGPATKIVTFDIGQGVSINEFEFIFYDGVFNEDLGSGSQRLVGIFPGCQIYGSRNESDWEFITSVSATDYDNASIKRTPSETQVLAILSPISENVAKKFRYFRFNFGTWIQADAVFQLRSIGFKTMSFSSRSEIISLFERLYYKTKGTSFDFVIHGLPNYSTLLPDDSKSTIYLNESRIQSITGNSSFNVAHKCRSRAGLEKHIDKDPTNYAGPGSDVSILEQKQEDLFISASDTLDGDSEFRVTLHSTFNTYLESFGMTYPSTTFLMQSNVPLLENIYGEIPNSGDVWAAAGHRYVNDISSTHQEQCGGIPSPWPYRRQAWTTDYCFMHYNHAGGGCDPGTSPFIVYAAGVAAPTLIGGELPGTVITT